MLERNRYGQVRTVTLIGAAANAVLGLLKFIGGLIYHSHALIADGFHSFADLITEIMVLFASKYGSQDADSDHPYGHQRIETAATLLLALLLIFVGVGIVWDAINKLITVHEGKPNWYTLPIVTISIIVNELLFHYTHYIGQKIQSALLLANAWHHRSDAASSIVVMVGLLGSLIGLPYLDMVAAIIVGMMIVKMGLDYGWNSVKELVDTAVEPAVLADIEHLIASVEGVRKMHQLRSRLMGGDILIDVHILVASHISVSEGHYIAQHVERTVKSQIDRVKDVTVHVDPEDDIHGDPSMHLPNRKMLEEALLMSWKAQFPDICHWTFHYLDGCMHIDLHKQTTESLSALRQRIASDLPLYPFIKKIRLYSESMVFEEKG